MMRGVSFVPGLMATLVATATLAACAPLQVSTYVRPEAETGRYLSYEWEPVGLRSIGDPRLDGNSVFESYVTAAIDEQLRVQGLEPTATGMADLRVRWSASTVQRAYASDRGTAAGGLRAAECADCGIDVFDEGTLAIDLVDAQTDRLIWRGWATAAIDGVIADQPRMERRLHDAVVRLLQRLPRGIGRTAPLL
jgi:hypothetical protein